IVSPALEESEPALRLAAAGAVLAIAALDPKVLASGSLDWATEALTDSSWTVRAQAAAILADADPSEAVPLLRKLVHAATPEVRRVAVEQAAADPDLGPAALAVALKDPAAPVKLQAAVLLADRGSKDGVDVLQGAVKKGGADGLRAYVALSKLDVQPVVALDPTVLLEAKDPSVRKLAVDEAARLPVAR